MQFGSVLAGACMGTVWLLLFGLFGGSTRGYVWLTVGAAVVAWLVALALLRYGDRGAAVGLAAAATLGISVASVLVVARWMTSGWPLW